MLTINIKLTNTLLVREDREYIEEKMRRLEKKFVFFMDEECSVFIEVERYHKHRKGKVFRSELQFKFPRQSLRAEAEGENWRAAFDASRNKAQRELKRIKESV